MDKNIEKAFEIVANNYTGLKPLIQFGIIIGLLAIAFMSVNTQVRIVGENESITYKNATYLNSSGFSETGTFNITTGAFNQSTPLFSISELNNQSWYGNESNSVGFTINITFTNVTKFTHVDNRIRYFSSSGTPSSHEVELMIFCPLHNDWDELKDYHNEPHWYTRSYEILDSEHYINNGTVLIQILHLSNGINSHRIWLDVLRLINVEY